MNDEELRAEYEAKLRERLKSLTAEFARIRKELNEEEEEAPTGNKWTPARRLAQSRRMKKLHREGKFS